MIKAFATLTVLTVLCTAYAAEDVDEQLIEITAMIEEGGSAPAYRPLTKLLREHPRDERVLRAAIETCYALSKYDEAIGRLNTWFAVTPKNHPRRQEMLRIRGKLKAAAASYAAKATSELRALIGLRYSDERLQAFVGKVGVSKWEACPVSGRMKFLMFRGEGLEMAFDDAKRLRSIHLHDRKRSTGSETWWARWPHVLPFGLKFGDSEDHVRAKIGQPSDAFFGIRTYPGHGVNLHFRKNESTLETVSIVRER